MADPLAVYGAVTGTVGALGVAWRVFEWWHTGRVAVEVTGSAGVVSPNPSMGQLQIYRGQREPAAHVIVEVVNRNRAIVVEEVGFLAPGKPVRQQLHGQPRQLPKRLSRGDKEMIWAALGKDLTMVIRGCDKLVPYCKDSEGRWHEGKLDEHFLRLAAKIKATNA